MVQGMRNAYSILIAKLQKWNGNINPLNAELNPICHLLTLLGSATIVVVSRLRVKSYLPEKQREA